MQPQCDSREPPGDDGDVGGPPHNENSSIALRVRSQATHALVVERVCTPRLRAKFQKFSGIFLEFSEIAWRGILVA